MNRAHGEVAGVDFDFRRQEYQEESPRQLAVLGEDWIFWHSTLPVNAFCRPSHSGPSFLSSQSRSGNIFLLGAEMNVSCALLHSQMDNNNLFFLHFLDHREIQYRSEHT